MPNWTPVSSYTRKNYLPLSKRLDDADYDSDEEMVGRTEANPILVTDTSSSESESESDVSMAPPNIANNCWRCHFDGPCQAHTPAPPAPVVTPAPPAPVQELCWMCGGMCHFIMTLHDDAAPAPPPAPVATPMLPRLESMDEVLRDLDIDEYFN